VCHAELVSASLANARLFSPKICVIIKIMKKAPKSQNDLTLKNIGNLFGRKFDEKFDKAFDQKFDQKLLPVFIELSELKQQITGLDKKVDFVDAKVDSLDTKISSVDAKLEAFRQETKENFNGVYDGLSALADSLDHDIEPRIKRLEDQHLFA